MAIFGWDASNANSRLVPLRSAPATKIGPRFMNMELSPSFFLEIPVDLHQIASALYRASIRPSPFEQPPGNHAGQVCRQVKGIELYLIAW